MGERGCRLDVVDGVGRIVLDRPERLNAMGIETLAALCDLARQVVIDPAIKVITLTGTGKAFSAGGDVAEMAAAPEAARTDWFLRGAGYLHDALTLLLRSDKPLIAGVNGVAAGAGFSLALAADLVVASEAASFTMAYTKIGLTPDGGGSFFLSKLVGHHRAMELMLTNRTLTAAEARDWGIVNRLVAPGEVEDALQAWASELANGPAEAFASLKALASRDWLDGLEAHLQAERLAIATNSQTAASRARIAAFVAKGKG